MAVFAQINVCPKEGMMILFHSFVKHPVKPNRGEEEC